MQHLVLIDGHHLMYRAYWAIPRTLKTAKGEQVNAVFGFASMLINILKREEPDALLFCFDAGEETFRHAENATYKEGRVETPDDFYTQIPRIIQVVEAFGLPHVSDGRYEADDFLGTYACAGEAAGMRVTIVTGDRDAFQLATDKVQIAIPHSGYQNAEYLGPEEIFAKYGIRPDQVPAYKGLVGDSSDNLPGVKGIGPKTAAELIAQYGTLEEIYAHLGDIRSSVRAKLEADKEAAFFCEHMAELVCDIPLPLSLEDIRLQELSLVTVSTLFQELEFTLLLRRLKEMAATAFGKRAWADAPVMPEASLERKAVMQQSLF